MALNAQRIVELTTGRMEDKLNTIHAWVTERDEVLIGTYEDRFVTIKGTSAFTYGYSFGADGLSVNLPGSSEDLHIDDEEYGRQVVTKTKEAMSLLSEGRVSESVEMLTALMPHAHAPDFIAEAWLSRLRPLTEQRLLFVEQDVGLITEGLSTRQLTLLEESIDEGSYLSRCNVVRLQAARFTEMIPVLAESAPVLEGAFLLESLDLWNQIDLLHESLNFISESYHRLLSEQLTTLSNLTARALSLAGGE